MKNKAKAGRSPRVGRIIGTLVGVILLLWILLDWVLLFFGSVTPASSVSTGRIGGRESGMPSDQSYKWSVRYTYFVDGKEYAGYCTAMGSSYGVRRDSTVHYLPAAPWISSLYVEDAFSLGTLAAFAVGAGLIFIVNSPPKGQRKARNPEKVTSMLRSERQRSRRITMAWIMQNVPAGDDSVEEYYANGWDRGDPSWKCTCGKWNTGAFCVHCGRRGTD